MHRVRDGEIFYVLPGGTLNPGESPSQAALREAKEETDLDVALGRQLGTTTDIWEGQKKVTYFFDTMSWSGTPKIVGEEAQRQSQKNQYQLRWVEQKDLSRIKIYPIGTFEEILKPLCNTG
jgi:ADP-ribose pyrophosphatase YjhB (NUDIX family)